MPALKEILTVPVPVQPLTVTVRVDPEPETPVTEQPVVAVPAKLTLEVINEIVAVSVPDPYVIVNVTGPDFTRELEGDPMMMMAG